MATSVPAKLIGWITASVVKHFYMQRGTLTMFVEGQHRQTEGLTEWVELRIDGPYTQWKSNNDARFTIEVNILGQCHEDESDVYRVRRLAADILAMFTKCIPIYRYGDEEADADCDSEFIGNFTLNNSGREQLHTVHFGKVDPDNAMYQTSVEGHYDTYLNVQEVIPNV